jgi:SAM-dependent methyltransferase
MLSSTTARLNRNTPFFDWYLMPEAYSAPLVQQAIIEFGLREGETMLDPFCGTGTSLLAARDAGCNAVGIEVNPFLCFASRVKTHNWQDAQALRSQAVRILAEARVRLDRACVDDLIDDSDLPEMPRRERWIARRVACKIVTLRDCIEKNSTEAARPFFLLALAAILRGASNMKLSPHAFGSREVKQDAPVLAMFEAKLEKMLADVACAEHEGRLSRTQVHVNQGDIRDPGNLSSTLLPAQLAVCSPPYLNNLDYTMQTRLELFFLGFVSGMDELKALRKQMMICDAKATYRDVEDWRRVEQIQSVMDIAGQIDEKLEDKGWGWDYGRMTRQYFGGLLRAMDSISRMLAPGAPLVMILGESAHAGILVPVPDIAAELGQLAGYTQPEVRELRTRRSSSHNIKLKESAVVLRKG